VAALFIFVPASILAESPLVQQYRKQSVWKGRAHPNLEMKSMVFSFQMQNQSELERVLKEQQDPSSPNYHRWLVPEQFGKRFGVSQDEYQRAVQWLQANGFSVKMQLGNRLRIYFDGVAADVERAFGVQMQLYEMQGKTYFANDVEPQIPVVFREHGLGIFGLDNFPKHRPLYQAGRMIAMGPADAHVAYNLLPLFQSGYDGSGQSIAIVARSDFNVSDVQMFRNVFELPPNDPVKIFVGNNPGNLGGGEETEVLLDTEWTGAIAKGATIQVVISDTTDIQTSIDYILNRLFTTRVMTICFGLGESAFSQQSVEYFASYFSQAAAQGQTVIVSSGDEGAQQSIGNNRLSTGADINHLCSSPYVVCVGGTTLNLSFDSSGNATLYQGETAWSSSGGGKSRFIPKPDYQFGLGVPADGQRDVPDVAAVGDPGGPGAFVVHGGAIDPRYTYGGTSLSAPIWAGVFALVNQFGSQGGVGWANPRLYQLGAQQSQGGAQVFNDVTVGSNSTGSVTGFNAGAGFDLVTGWGSFNGDQFVRNFAIPTNPPAIVPADSTPTITGFLSGSTSSSGCALSRTQYTINVPAGALQLVATLDGPVRGDVDLYVRRGQPVGDTGSFNPFIADYRSEGSTPHEAVYVGPNSTIPLTQGTYFIALSNCMPTDATFTLSASVITPFTPTKIEELSTDNGILEDYFNPNPIINPDGSLSYPPSGVNGTIVVNRLRPTRYPSTLTKIRIYSTYWDTDPTDKQIRIIAFNDSSGTGTPPSAPTLLVDQQVTISGTNGFMEYTISNPQPVIQSGDWYVGFQHPAAYNGVLASLNENGVWLQADFVSTNNAASFTGPYQQPNPYPPPSFFTPNFMIRAVVQSQPQTTANLTVPPVGAVTETTSQANAQLQVGYATASTTSGTAPFGTAVYSYSPSGNIVTSANVVTEVGVPSSVPTTRGRIFIDYRTGVAAWPNGTGTISINTGMALVNPGAVTAHPVFTLRDGAGVTLATGQATLAAGNHQALFIDQLNDPPNPFAPGFLLPPNFSTVTQFGSLDIVSDQPLSILALRQTTNQRPETLLTSTPMADLTQPLSAVPLYFPQFADGYGYTTMVVLLNTSNAPETGTLKLFQNDGTPLVVQQVGGPSNSSFSYSIPAGGVYVFQTDGSPAVVNAGSAQVIPDTGMNTPVGAGVFSYTPPGGGILVTQAGIPSATPTTHARIYVDRSGGHETGLAIANPTGTPLNFTLNAFQVDGTTPAGSGGGTLSGNGHAASYAWQFISGLPAGFTGVLDISSPQQFVALTLRDLTNARGYLLTTFPIADFTQTAPNPLIFPQIADSGGYQTQIILISSSGATSNVTVNYFSYNGQPLALKSGGGGR
jgi:hypothetical protein